MEERIKAHQEARPEAWHTLKEPTYLPNALTPVLHHYDTVLLDCLTLWVSNLLLRSPDIQSARKEILSEVEALLGVYQKGNASWVIVSNEVGLGVVPATELGRIYADELGRANQLIAAQADDVYFMAAGLPLTLKGPNHKGISPVRKPPILAISNDAEDELISQYTWAGALVGLTGLNCELLRVTYKGVRVYAQH